MIEDDLSPPPSVLSEEQQQVVFDSSPKGTWMVLFIYGIIFMLLWLYFWYGLFLPAGLVQ